MHINLIHQYNENDIATLLDILIKQQGGKVQNHSFLLAGQAPQKTFSDNGIDYYVAVTPPIDHVGIAKPINFYLDKSLQPKPAIGHADTRKDAFSELMPILADPNALTVNAKILFLFNHIERRHWLTGEIVITKAPNPNNAGKSIYTVKVTAHDPYGGGQFDYECFEQIKESIIDRIKKEHNGVQTNDITVTNVASTYKQRQADASSAGPIAVEDLTLRLEGKTLDRASVYPYGAETLRLQYINLIKANLPINNENRKSFVERATAMENQRANIIPGDPNNRYNILARTIKDRYRSIKVPKDKTWNSWGQLCACLGYDWKISDRQVDMESEDEIKKALKDLGSAHAKLTNRIENCDKAMMYSGILVGTFVAILLIIDKSLTDSKGSDNDRTVWLTFASVILPILLALIEGFCGKVKKSANNMIKETQKSMDTIEGRQPIDGESMEENDARNIVSRRV